MDQKKVIALHTRDDVAKHNTPQDIWVIVDNDIYDLSGFLGDHPGGEAVLRSVAGQDASSMFRKYHRISILNKFKERLQIGQVAPVAGQEEDPHTSKRFSLRSFFQFRGQSFKLRRN